MASVNERLPDLQLPVQISDLYGSYTIREASKSDWKCYIKSGWLVGGGLRTYLVVLAMLSVFAVLAAGTIAANGRARLVSSQESGPYQIDVSIIPAEAIVGRTHVSILVLTLADKEPLTVAHVEISATGPIGGAGFGPIPASDPHATKTRARSRVLFIR